MENKIDKEKELSREESMDEDNLTNENVNEGDEEFQGDPKKIRQKDLEKRGFEESSEENNIFEEKLAEEFKNLQEEKEELFSRLQRLQADFDNYRKRARVERFEAADNATAELLKALLPVIDNFERAVNSAEEEGGFVSGVKMIYKQLNETLEKEGLEPIQAEGETFDPHIHEAVMQVDSPDHQENIVVEELQKGYKFKGKLLRPSMVKVAK